MESVVVAEGTMITKLCNYKGGREVKRMRDNTVERDRDRYRARVEIEKAWEMDKKGEWERERECVCESSVLPLYPLQRVLPLRYTY